MDEKTITKKRAIEIFDDGDSKQAVANLASAIGVTRQAIYQWPEILPQKTTDQVIGAAIRLKRPGFPVLLSVA